MATPISLKKMEELKNRVDQKKKNQYLFPLTNALERQGQPNYYPQQQPHYSYPVVGQGTGPNFVTYREPRVDFTADEVGFNNQFQYTNFASTNYGNTDYNFRQPRFNNKPTTYQRHPMLNNKNRPIRLSPQTVLEVPENITTDDYLVAPTDIYCFGGQSSFLAAHYPCEITIDGHTYHSVEHYYQACKLFSLAGCEYAAQLRAIDNPLKAKTKTRQILMALKIDNLKVEEWKKTHGYFMYKHAMVHKFVQNESLRKMLLDTDNKILAHAYNRDSFFACGMTSEEVEKWAQDKQGSILKYPIFTQPEELKYIPLTGNGKNLFGIACMQVRQQIRAHVEGNKRRGLPTDKLTVEDIISNLHTAMNAVNLVEKGAPSASNKPTAGGYQSTAAEEASENALPPGAVYATPKILKKGEALL